MTTFVLKKYEEKPVEPTSEGAEPVEEKETIKKEPESISVKVDSSVAEVVANALNTVLVNKGVEIEEKEEDIADSEAVSISTESITEDPMGSLRYAKASKYVLLTGESFKDKTGDWFISNMKETNTQIFYSVESFVTHIAKVFDL